MAFPPVPVDEGRHTVWTAPAVAKTEDVFIVRGRLVLEEGPEAT